ncbi:hypothetical protein HYY69_08470 [Candidatus Woesearchaeota archaeon]|nr:hypothetical protein [Candidatus Woesearchaeota archaeon]
MAERVPFSSLPQQILFKGIFDFDALYKQVYDWLTFRGFQLHETKFKKKAKEYGLEIEVNWDAWMKMNEMVMNKYNLHFHIWDATYIDVVHDGEKKKLMKARIFVRIERRIDFDYRGTFQGSLLKKKLWEFLVKYVYKMYFDAFWEDKLRFKAYQLANVVKEALDMQTKGNEHWDVW